MYPLPIFLDIEASSLGSRSYPIEVAWNTPDGTVEAHLISPAAIARWTDWSVQAEQLHGLSREVLYQEGKAPAWVGRRLNQQLAGHVVYSDDPEYDGMWLAELFAVSYGPGPAFEVRSACPPHKLSPHNLCQPSLFRIEFDDSLPLLWPDGR